MWGCNKVSKIPMYLDKSLGKRQGNTWTGRPCITGEYRYTEQTATTTHTHTFRQFRANYSNSYIFGILGGSQNTQRESSWFKATVLSNLDQIAWDSMLYSRFKMIWFCTRLPHYSISTFIGFCYYFNHCESLFFCTFYQNTYNWIGLSTSHIKI